MARHIFTGTAAPTITPTKVGQHFIDTTAEKAYISTGTASSADWKINPLINDGSTATDELWSSDKINTDLGGKAASSHTHVNADVTDFDAGVTASTHAGRTDDPHSVTKTQVGLGNVQDTKVKLDATAAPTATDDSAAGYTVGSRWINTTTDKEYVCLDSTATSAVWTETTQAGGASSYYQTVLFSDGTNPWTESASVTYKLMGCIMYPGSTVTGSLTKISAILFLGAGTDLDIRIYDSTNSQVIVEKIDITDSTATIHDLGTISNVPTGEAIFNIELLATGSGRKANLHSILIR